MLQLLHLFVLSHILSCLSKNFHLHSSFVLPLVSQPILTSLSYLALSYPVCLSNLVLSFPVCLSYLALSYTVCLSYLVLSYTVCLSYSPVGCPPVMPGCCREGQV